MDLPWFLVILLYDLEGRRSKKRKKIQNAMKLSKFVGKFCERSRFRPWPFVCGSFVPRFDPQTPINVEDNGDNGDNGDCNGRKRKAANVRFS